MCLFAPLVASERMFEVFECSGTHCSRTYCVRGTRVRERVFGWSGLSKIDYDCACFHPHETLCFGLIFVMDAILTWVGLVSSTLAFSSMRNKLSCRSKILNLKTHTIIMPQVWKLYQPLGGTPGDHSMLPRPCILQYILNFRSSLRNFWIQHDVAQTMYFTIYY